MRHNTFEAGIKTYSTDIKLHIQFFSPVLFQMHSGHKITFIAWVIYIQDGMCLK